MGVKVQARVESALHAPAKVAPAKCANRQGVVVAGGKPGVLTTMARLSQWALENGYLDSERTSGSGPGSWA